MVISRNSPVTHSKTKLVPYPKEGECKEPRILHQSIDVVPAHHGQHSMSLLKGSCLLISLGSSLMFDNLSLWLKFYTFLNRSKIILILKTLLIYFYVFIVLVTIQYFVTF